MPRLGAKAFEQSAGFLRITDGEHPLDASAVHPERYTVVKTMAKDLGCTVKDLMQDPDRQRAIVLNRYITEEVGKPQMPVIRETIGIPDGSSVKVTVVDASYSTRTGYRVYPVQQLELDSDENGEFVIDEEFYSQDVFYPEEIVRVGATGIWRDISIVSLEVKPIQFNPATGELKVYDHIRVKLEYSGGVAVAKTVEPKFGRMYRSSILNYEFLNITEKYLNAEDIPPASEVVPVPEGAGHDVTP